MYKQNFLILIGFIGQYLVADHHLFSCYVYWFEFGLIVLGYSICLVQNLEKLKRMSPEHEFQDEEEEKLFGHKHE